MADERCPSCGEPLPPEAGQHALVPSAGIVECPSCGATVTLEKAGAAETDEPEEESFSGHETVEGVMEEIREKEDL